MRDVELDVRIVTSSIWGLRMTALLALGGGAALAYNLGDGHWLSSSGALVVVASLIATLWQFRFERLTDNVVSSAVEQVRQRAAVQGLSGEASENAARSAKEKLVSQIDQCRTYILVNSIAIAAVGELVHGFGDVVWRAIVKGAH
jgi:hypothetical protein